MPIRWETERGGRCRAARAAQRYPARIGDIQGEIDAETAEFTSIGPDPECLDECAWRLRAIDVPAGGYWNVIDGRHDGPILKGTWYYRPWPRTRAHMYAFVPESQNRRREFAVGLWLTATPGKNIADAVAGIAIDEDVVSP